MEENKFKKYCENVFVAECNKEYAKGEIIELETKYGKLVECEIYNLVAKANDKFYYSIVRVDDKSYVQKKLEKLEKARDRKLKESDAWFEKAQEGRDFLSLAEPIKIGHHSEGRHRALIERNYKRMGNCVKATDEAIKLEKKAEYWKEKTEEINLSMPESLDFYTFKLEEAIAYYKGLKNKTIQAEHSYSMQYANKKVKELTRKVEIAQKLWE